MTTKSDIWFLGALLIEMITLAPAFNGSLSNMCRKILSEEYNTLPKFCSEDIQELISLMLKKNPSARPSIDEIL